MPRNLLKLFALALPTVALLVACGSSKSSTGTGSGGSTDSSSTHATTGTTGTGGNVGTGGTGGTTGGACTDPADQMVLASEDITTISENCALANLGNTAATQTCIQNGGSPPPDGGGMLTNACAGCFGSLIGCVFNNCIGSCAAAPSSDACTCCRLSHCGPAFATCSGLSSGEEPDAGCGDGG